MDIGYHALCCHVIRLRFGSLALLVRLCGAPGAFGLGFLLARIALGVGLVLLGLALSAQIVEVGHLSDDLLGLALHTLDGAFDGLPGPTVLSHAISSLRSAHPGYSVWIRGADCVHPVASPGGPVGKRGVDGRFPNT